MKKNIFAVFKKVYIILANTPLRHVPGMLSLSNIFFRTFWAQGSVIEIQGNKMYINVNDPNPALRKTFQAYGMNLIHEEMTTEIFRRIAKPGDVVLDLGANIGYFTLLAAQAVGPSGKVFSFEPEPSNFSYLRKNIEINNYTQVQPFQKAVADKMGKTQLYICSYDTGHHTINQYGGIEAARNGRSSEKRAIDIDTVILDEFLKDKTDHVNIIKMDVEGAEALALAGMRSILKNNNVKVFLEYFPMLMKEMGSDPKPYLESLLNDFGFTVYAIGHDYDLKGSKEELIKIRSFEELNAMLTHAGDHVNLYLTKDLIA